MRVTAHDAKKLTKQRQQKTVRLPVESDLERMFVTKLKQRGLPMPEREGRLIPGRRFRVDFYYPDKMLAIELEGGVYTRGRHTRGKGFESDCTKYNTLTMMGWRVLRFTTGMVEDDSAIDAVEKALK